MTHYFYTLKALWDGQGNIKMYYGMSRVKKQLSGKRSTGFVRKTVMFLVYLVTTVQISIKYLKMKPKLKTAT